MERELFVLIGAALAALPEARRRPAKARFTDRGIVLTFLWAVLHDRPVDRACRRRNWPAHDRTRPLPSGSTMSRRLRSRAVLGLLERLRVALRVPVIRRADPPLLDAKPVVISAHGSDPDSRFGRAGGGMARGYKLHCVNDSAGNPQVFEVTPMNAAEPVVARRLLERLPSRPGATMLADGNYDANDLYDLAAARGVRLVTAPKRKNARGLGHCRQSPHRLEAIALRQADPEVMEPRRLIEGHFGTMGNVVGGLSPLPNHVRRLHRVDRWVRGKLIIDAAHRLRRSCLRAA